MANANVNLGIEALLRYASTSTYQDESSWTATKEFVPADWQTQLEKEFVPNKLVHSVGYAPTSLDFQSNAFTRLA